MAKNASTNNPKAKSKGCFPWKTLIALVILFFVAQFGVSLFIQKYFTEERIVLLLEENLNGRVSLGSYNVSVFPTAIEITEFGISERDEAAENKQPLADRGAVDAYIFTTEQFVIRAELRKLLQGEIEVEEILIKSPELDMVIYEDGTNNLEKVLVPPTVTATDTKTASVKPEAEGKPPSTTNSASTSTPKPSSTESKSEQASDEQSGDFLAKLGELKLEQANVDVYLEAAKLKVDLEPFDLTLRDIAVNPNNLASMNDAELNLAGELSLDNPENADSVWAFIDFSGPAKVKLFNEETGELSPNITTAIQLDDASFLSSDLPLLSSAWKKIKSFESLGLDTLNIPEKANFSRSKQLAVNLNENVMTFREPIGVNYSGWEVGIDAGSKMDLAANTHSVSFDLVADGPTTQYVLSKIAELTGKLKTADGNAQSSLDAAIHNQLLNQDGFLTLKFSSSGGLESPTVALETEMPDVTSLLKAEAKSQLKNLVDDKLGDKLGDDSKAKDLLKKFF